MQQHPAHNAGRVFVMVPSPPRHVVSPKQVSLSEFKRWLEANGAARGMAEEEVEALFNSVDVDNSGAVRWVFVLSLSILILIFPDDIFVSCDIILRDTPTSASFFFS